jgi:hypothetical protein
MTEQASQNLGSVATVTESYSAGVGSAGIAANLPQTVWGLSGNVALNLKLDASVLIAYLAAKIGGPIPTEVAAFLEATLKAT